MTGLHRLARDATQPAVGRDIEAWCNKCAGAMEHVIVAMVGREVVQVRCRTCGGTHKYKSGREATRSAPATRSERPKAASASAAAQRAPSAKPATSAGGVTAAGRAKAEPAELRAARQVWTRNMASRDRATAVTYAPSIAPSAGTLIDHKTFGYGLVDSVHDGKARVLFEDGYRLLAVGR